MSIKEQIRLGALEGKARYGASLRGMTLLEFLEEAIEDSTYVPLKTFAKRYSGTIVQLAASLEVTPDTISKWRSGYSSRCSKELKLKILKLYGVKVR